MIRLPLDKALRRALEATVVTARDIAEQAAAQALKRLSVGDENPADYLNDQQRSLRNRLRAHGRQLGDIKLSKGQSITKLITEVAYEHWHRMLFARFLEQNSLLMYDEHTSLTLAECNELVQDSDVARDDLERRCQSGWELAGVLASKMLPQIFRIDSPVFELELAPEHQRGLEQLVIGLALETFQAQDSLGWVYQFWQSKRKKEVNDSEVKIGADELSPVTQLFTEPYMVSFLLDNSLGAWWAGQRLTDSDWQQASNEQELRDKAAIPEVPLSYLRFVKDETSQQWQPASGTFDAWPKKLSELKTLDPCCGSGHFLVAAFLMLVPMRIQAENLTAQQAIDRVLSDNLHGLELDQRCVELAAFAVALEAWRYPQAGGYRSLPELHLACSGLTVNAKKEDWVSLAGNHDVLRMAFGQLYQQFKDAPVLGSLINPKASLAKGTLFELQWAEVEPLLSTALQGESQEERRELAVVAKGLSKAAMLLSEKYNLVITNVPYLGAGKQTEVLREFSENYYPDGKADLANVFLERCIEFLEPDEAGLVQVVMPENWLFLYSYTAQREKILRSTRWNFLVNLGGGAEAFERGPGNAVNICAVSLLSSDKSVDPSVEWVFRGVDTSRFKTPQEKAIFLKSEPVASVHQINQLSNPDSRVHLGKKDSFSLLSGLSDSYLGLGTGDFSRFGRNVWEFQGKKPHGWEFLQCAPEQQGYYGGYSYLLAWSHSECRVRGMDSLHRERIHNQDQSGQQAWGRTGVSVALSGDLKVTLYTGHLFDKSTAALIPSENSNLTAAIYAYCSSKQYLAAVRKIDKKIIVANGTLVKVPFDVDYWTKIAEEQYPNGLPQPYSNDPTQWIFHGHPCGAVSWDEEIKRSSHSELRVDYSVLQVAVARLLGYRWPAELDPEMELALEQREWVQRCQALDAYVDDDGIVCLPAVRGEKAADQRLEALLQAAYGKSWTTPLKNRLLEAVSSKSLSLWLRDKFFEQHCKLFQHRPFIWHIWDGLRDGFSALVNYHKLDKAGLERLIYTYLGDWIRTQQVGMASGEDGAQERLLAAESLKEELEAILEGEAPYDIFVRWKPLAEQPIGWSPDLNDGVRLNIRPFLYASAVGKKGAGILRWMPNIKWTKDRGKDVESAPWYTLGLQYDEGEGARINDHHLSLAEKQAARS